MTLNLSKAEMSELLLKIRGIADRSLRNGASDAATGLYYIHCVEELLEENGIFERNEIHADCDGEGCVHCNFGRVRQEGDPINPQASKPNERALRELRRMVKAELE